MYIIQLSKLLGNYNYVQAAYPSSVIIQLSKLLGNYNTRAIRELFLLIIQLSKLLGNYNLAWLSPCVCYNYTTIQIVREL